MGSVEEVTAVNSVEFSTNDVRSFPQEVCIVDTHYTGINTLVMLHLYLCGQGKSPDAIIEVGNRLA